MYITPLFYTTWTIWYEMWIEKDYFKCLYVVSMSFLCFESIVIFYILPLFWNQMSWVVSCIMLTFLCVFVNEAFTFGDCSSSLLFPRIPRGHCKSYCYLNENWLYMCAKAEHYLMHLHIWEKLWSGHVEHKNQHLRCMNDYFQERKARPQSLIKFCESIPALLEAAMLWPLQFIF